MLCGACHRAREDHAEQRLLHPRAGREVRFPASHIAVRLGRHDGHRDAGALVVIPRQRPFMSSMSSILASMSLDLASMRLF